MYFLLLSWRILYRVVECPDFLEDQVADISAGIRKCRRRVVRAIRAIRVVRAVRAVRVIRRDVHPGGLLDVICVAVAVVLVLPPSL